MRIKKFFLFYFSLLASSISLSLEHYPEEAAIASAHSLASEAGIEILKRGGNAFDAAIAVSAVLSVVEPYGSGLGGGGFFLLHRSKDNLQVMIDGREVAPISATRDMYLDEDGNPIPRASRDGPLSSGIPGLPASLEYIANHYGNLPLSVSLEPAIRHAENGFPAYSTMLKLLERKINIMNEEAKRIFMPNGSIPSEGDLIIQKDLANTLKILGEEGFSGFYRGEVAKRLVEGVNSASGIWSLDDLASYQIKEREPIIGYFQGMQVIAPPPPSSGGIGLINMLNILSGYQINNLDSVSRIHLIVEAMRRAYRDRAQYIGDSDFVNVPIDKLIDKHYASSQRASININKSTPSNLLPGISPIDYSTGDQTSHFSIIDNDGNIVSATQSINFSYGSGFIPKGTGVILNNEMDDFSIKLGTPNGYELIGNEANEIAPGKRMLSSMTPTIIIDDRGLAVLGTPGGSRIITMVLLSALAWNQGESAESITSLPRFHHQFFPDLIQYEPDAFSDDEIKALKDKGHSLRPLNSSYGNMHVVTWDFETGDLDASSDPRGHGEPRFLESVNLE
ncbi:MAG: gamma-glutamyltransferase [Gammaproteobacteria bacterium]|nr:gamma-glutamyltransferase [Gammaproteobacteria bacterium]|tara:strand:+ start:206 stop:1897 length:1692 start_codon:yes stop_codon:yes gene_type:complete